jgi:hypothetical protein
MSIIGSNILAGASGQAGGGGAYEIERSVRFSSSDSAYLSRTPGSLGNRKTWTWAGWVKRSVLGTRQQLFSAPLSSNGTYIEWQNDLIGIEEYTSGFVFKVAVAAVQRDPSAWYHIVFAFDTTIASPSSDRVKIYINGILQTSLSSSSYPSQNHQAAINATTLHKIGAFPNPGDAGNFYYFNGLLADCFLIDGQALDPTSFGEFDTNGVWQPIEYTGTFGTNGFHLPLSDNSTAAALGTDTSSNGNDWTVNNITPSDGTRYTYNIATMTNEKNDATDSLSHLFDGLLSTTCASINGTDGTITFSPAITGITSLRIHAQGKPGTGYFVVNGTEDYGNSIGDEVYQWITITGVSSLSTIFIRHVTGYSKTTVQAIEVNGVILTDGAAGDSLVDSPTNGSQVDTGVGGEVVGNYCTLNPLDNGGLTLANGNLDFSRATASWVSSRSTFGVSSGKWYWEVTLSTGNDCMAGISKNDAALSSYFANVANGWAYNAQNGQKYNNGAGSAYGDSWVGGNDTVGVAFDADAGSIYFYKNGIVQNSGTAAFTGLTSGPYFPSVALYGTSTAFINFGQRAFAYQTPGTNRPASTYKALCTTNLPEPTIADGSTAMDVVTYTGNGSTQTISGLNFSPDFGWFKRRGPSAASHFLFDQVRGAGKFLVSNTTAAEGNDSVNTLQSFDSTGYTMGSTGAMNESGSTYVVWSWDAGSSTVTNTAGSITSQVRANTSAGFSVVTYTSSSSVSTVGHGLGVAPYLIITKNRSVSNTWWTYHNAIGNTKAMRLDTTDAQTTISSTWNNTSPTSTVFTVGGEWGNGNNIVAYCFAPVAGYSAMGSYVGNGSSDGPMVYTGFRIKWLLLKNTTSSGDMWFLLDSSRDPENPNTLLLQPNTSDQELDNATNYSTDLLSNGFKLRSSTSRNNSSGNTFIYIAFAENPLKTARAR